MVITLSIYLGERYGLVGITLALLISHITTTHQYLWRWSRRKLGVSFLDIVGEDSALFLSIFVGFTSLGILFQLASRYLSAFEAFVIGAGLFGGASLFVITIFAITVEDRHRLLSLFRNKIRCN